MHAGFWRNELPYTNYAEYVVLHTKVRPFFLASISSRSRLDCDLRMFVGTVIVVTIPMYNE